MKKLLLSASMAAMFGAVIPAAQAATVAQPFNVTVTLTSVCTMAAIGDLAFGTYLAFRATPLVATPTSAVLTCTRGLTGMTAAFDTGVNAIDTGAAAPNASGVGVVAGLQYTVTGTRSATTTGAAATTASIGTADAWTYAIAGSMPANQAGTCASASCPGTQVRTLTVTY